MTDYGHEETDKQLKKLERKIHAEYEQASKEVQTKLDDYLRRFRIKDNIKREAVAVGEITQEEYTKWRTGQIMIGKRWEEMRDTLAQDLTNTDKIAMSMVREYMPEVYALNHNYGTFEAEKESMIDTSYTLYDRQTVENLIKKNPDLLPKPSVDIPKDLKWNKQKITSAITQGILQGEDIRKISKRLRNVTDMDKRAAIRNARTMTTSAENAGRSDSYTRAREMGIEMEQIWLATLDERTRDSHRKLDGEKIKVGDKWHHPKFSNGLRYPGDPEGPASEVYNCRCTLIAQVAGINLNPSDISKRNNHKLGGMSYEEWKEEHQQRAVIGFKRKDGSINYIEGEELKDADEVVSESAQESQFVPAETIQDAEQQAAKIFNLPKEKVNYDHVNVDVANEINRTANAIIEKYPELNNLAWVQTGNGKEFVAMHNASFTKKWEMVGNALEIGRNAQNVSLQEIQKKIEHLSEIGWTTKGADFSRIIWHEFGHAYASYADGELFKLNNPNYLTDGGAFLRYLRDDKKTFYGSVIKEAKEIAKQEGSKFNVSNISQYATKAKGEMFAEAFAEYNTSSNPANESRWIMEAVFKLIGGKK